MRKTIVLLTACCLISVFASCEKDDDLDKVILPDMGTVKNHKDSIPIPALPITP